MLRDTRPSPEIAGDTPRPGWSRDRRGFTIPEVAMAVFVMAFGIASSIIAMQTGFRYLDIARGNTLASQIMQSEIERVRLLSWSAIATLPASATVDLSSMFTTDPSLAARFALTRSVTDDATRDARYITLTVSWKTYDGQTHTRSFTTLYARNGLYDYYYTDAGGT
jgi:Tfp pilus assembly protein PilV